VARTKSTSRARAGVLACAAAVAALAFPGIASAAVNSTVAAGALTATSDGADPITITCVANQVKVNGADPAPATACAAITSISVTGGPGANAIDLSGVTAAAFPAVTAVTVNGGAGTDTITGSEHADRLVGGDNNDDVSGNAGNDTIVWNGGDDDDINDGEAGTDTIEVNGAAAFGETFTVKPSATPGRVQFDRAAPTPTPPGLFSLDIGTSERLDLNMNGGDDSFTADAGLDALGFALDVDGGDGNDSIDGGDGADVLKGGNGDDRIVPDDNRAGTRDVARGDAGNDTIVWNGGDDDDINDGGDGDDTSVVNGAPAGERFTIRPSTTVGRVQFDRTSTNPAPFSIDIGTTELLRLNANGGDDRIKGFKGLAGLIETELNGEDGNDEIRGTDAEDRLNGGNGHDVVNSRDSAEDLLDCGTGLDLAIVDRRDFLRNCNIVVGGHLRVRVPTTTLIAANGVAALPLKCAGTRRCKGVARLRSGGRTLAAKKFNITRRSTTVHLKLNGRGLRRLATAPATGLKVSVQIDARDARGNGWRSTTRLKLKG
jgi:Ca2+-binding RTX toxin-like protein